MNYAPGILCAHYMQSLGPVILRPESALYLSCALPSPPFSPRMPRKEKGQRPHGSWGKAVSCSGLCWEGQSTSGLLPSMQAPLFTHPGPAHRQFSFLGPLKPDFRVRALPPGWGTSTWVLNPLCLSFLISKIWQGLGGGGWWRCPMQGYNESPMNS